MPTLFLMCGLPGAGKTTWAKRLESEQNALRLTPDDWLTAIFGDDRTLADAYREKIEALQWEVAARALRLGVHVILDFGFWGRSERADYHARAKALGADAETHFLLLSREELWERISARNAATPPNAFSITEEELDLWLDWFEPPTEEELAENARQVVV